MVDHAKHRYFPKDQKLFTDTQPIPVTNNGKVHLTLGLLGFALLNPTYKIYVGYA
jgi:hypothetical protein